MTEASSECPTSLSGCGGEESGCSDYVKQAVDSRVSIVVLQYYGPRVAASSRMGSTAARVLADSPLRGEVMPLTKDAESGPAVNPTRLRTVAVAEDGARPQPVCIEVPITVQGVRAAKPGEQREPFTENTRTVIVFANGAVVRLAAPVNAGQPLFLTNERTHKEIVCQVVKSKTYASVPGYVELEFTEPNVGFWGMRFPTDRLHPQTEPAAREAVPPVEEPQPVAPPVRPAVVPETSPSSPAIVAAESFPIVSQPEPVSPPAAQIFAGPELTVPLVAPEAEPEEPVAPASFVLPENPPIVPQAEPVSTPTVQPVEKSKPAVSPARPVIVSEEPALPAHTFASVERAATPPQPAARPPQGIRTVAEASKRPAPVQPLHESATPHVAARVPASRTSRVEAVHSTPAPLSQSPAASASEPLVFSGKTRPSPSAGSHSVSHAARPQEAVFTGSLLDKKGTAGKARSNSAVAGLIAAGVLFAAAGGGWYWWQHGRSSSEHRSSTPSSASNAAAATVVAANSSADRGVLGESKLAPPAAVSTQTRSSSRPSEAASDASAAKPERVTKKPDGPQFRLSTPVVSRPDSSAEGSSVAPEIAPEVAGNMPSAPFSGLVSTEDRQPKAPRASQVVQPKRISSVAPQYPTLARSQRIQGDVTLDVLVDTNGRPSAVKVLLGPTLLQ